MAHFAQLDENNVVIQVIVINDRDCCDDNGIENEDVGIAFCQQLLGEDTRWKQTSYNRNMRVHYAGIGMRYNEDLDAFVHESPFPSWVLDSATANWVSPLGPAPTLTEEEINNIKELKQQFKDLTDVIGNTEVQIMNLQIRKEQLKFNLQNLQQQELVLAKELEEKYGEGTISLESGEFLPRK